MHGNRIVAYRAGRMVALPCDVNLYICGFPCNPFSMRHTGSQCFAEEKSKPFFAMLKTMQSVDPDMYILENVEGLQRRRVQWEGEERSCLDVVQLLLRQHLPRHRHALAPPHVTTPIAFGEHIARPREFVLGLRRNLCRQGCDADFENEVLRLLREIQRCLCSAGAVGAAVPDVSHAEARSSFMRGLNKGPAAQGPYETCGCSFGTFCSRHVSGRGSTWRTVHEQLWAETAAVSAAAIDHDHYFRMAWAHGVDASSIVQVARERDLANLHAARCGLVDLNTFMVNDMSQSWGWDQFRQDGNLPTLATGSKLFSFGLGRFLTPAELFRFMGFPPTYNLHEFEDAKLKQFLGNTMHVAVVGILMSILLSVRA